MLRKISSIVPARLRRIFRDWFPHPPVDHAALWQRTCHKWVLGDARVENGELHVHGWLIAPPDRRSSVEFLVNGQLFDRIAYPLPRPDVAAHLTFAIDPTDSGFILGKDWPGSATDPGDLTISVRDRNTRKPLGPDYPVYEVPSQTRFGPAPASNQMARVIGPSSAFDFRVGGYTAFRRLESAANAAGTTLAQLPRVLDWGCGCARVSRYFLTLPGITLTGVDVDPDNVKWCQAHLPGGHWETIPLRPPTRFPAGSFDLAFGISVFTHLKEPDQDAWLDELQRLVRPGGLALMTFHGEASAVWSGLTPDKYARLRSHGFCDQANPIYDAEIGEADYYRDVFHTADYIHRVWGRRFEIVEIRPSEVAHQDLVVMRRR